MYHPLAIANFFIGKSTDSGKSITLMKLIKLVYISHGWFRGLTGQNLITEAAQAWQYGPVIPTVYHEFKRYKDQTISKQASILVDIEDDGHIDFVFPQVENQNDVDFLNKIWEIYQNYTAIELSNLTHQTGTPWEITYNKLGGRNNRDTIIPNELIEEHYKGKIDGQQESN